MQNFITIPYYPNQTYLKHGRDNKIERVLNSLGIDYRTEEFLQLLKDSRPNGQEGFHKVVTKMWKSLDPHEIDTLDYEWATAPEIGKEIYLRIMLFQTRKRPSFNIDLKEIKLTVVDKVKIRWESFDQRYFIKGKLQTDAELYHELLYNYGFLKISFTGHAYTWKEDFDIITLKKK